MRVVNGMHLSNHRHWFVEDQIAASKATGALTILHHLMIPRDDLADQWGDPENEYWLCKLRDGWEPQGIPPAPERLIHVRCYHADWAHLDPVTWARHIVGVLGAVRSGGKTYDLWEDPFVCVSAANEQNLHYEAGDLDPANQPGYQTVAWYEFLAKWNLTFWREVDRLRPDRAALSCWSALAYGHEPPGTSPDAEYQIPAIREAIDYCDLGASHPYAHLNWLGGAATVDRDRDGYYHLFRPFRPANLPGHDTPLPGVLGQFPGKPWLFTECGTFSHSHRDKTDTTLDAMRRFLSECAKSGRVLGATWFIGNTDDAHTDNNIGANDELRRALADLQEYRTSAEVPLAHDSPSPPPVIDPNYPPVEADMNATRRTDATAKAVLAKAERVHEAEGLRINPDAALVKAARVSGFVPTTDEYDYHGDREYICQRYEHTGTGEVRALYAPRDNFATVYYARRGDNFDEPQVDVVGKFIDVSSHQGHIDWDRVKAAGVTDAYIRLSIGASHVDEFAVRNWREANRVGIRRGGYHAWFPFDPVTQARLMEEGCGGDWGYWPPVWDTEWLEGYTVGFPELDNIYRTAALIGSRSGKVPACYTSAAFWTRTRWAGPVMWARDFRLWAPGYGPNDGQYHATVARGEKIYKLPDVPSDWKREDVFLHQYTSRGHVDGISGNVDLNVRA